jgi:hypothetical protein
MIVIVDRGERGDSACRSSSHRDLVRIDAVDGGVFAEESDANISQQK